MWRNAEEFEPRQRGPRGGSSPELRFFVERATGRLFVGKSSVQAIMGDEGIPESLEWGYVGPYEEELREALAFSLYGILHVTIPTVALCSLPTAPRGDAFQGENARGPKSAVHILTSVEPSFTVLGSAFIENYRAHTSVMPNMPVRVQTDAGDLLPLTGFGALLAAAAILDDRDVIGANGSNAGYTVNGTTCRVLKIDGGGAFDFRIHSGAGAPRAARGVVYDCHQSIQFSELTVPDREEFLGVLKSALSDLQPESGILHLLETNLAHAPDGQPTHTMPIPYLKHLNNGLMQRLFALVASFRADLDHAILLAQEGRIAKVIFVAPAADDEQAHAQDVVAAVDELILVNAKLRGLISRAALSNHIEETDCATFQLPRAPATFVGREEDLVALCTSLTRNDRSIISQQVAGMGGVGKTTLATVFARAAAHGGVINGVSLDYGYVAWLRAEHMFELDMQCISLSELWCGATSAGVRGPEARDKLWRKLCSGMRQSLVIFDNLSNTDQLAELLPCEATPGFLQGKIHFLVTTRDTRSKVGTTRLGPFSASATHAFLRQRVPEMIACDSISALSLHEVVGGHPLAISQAIAYMAATKLSMRDFLAQFRDVDRRATLLHGVLADDPHPRTIGTLVVLAFNSLLATGGETSVVARKVLECAAFLPPDAILKDALTRLTQCSVCAIEQALRELQQLGLVTVSYAPNLLNMHRLVQFCIRNHLKHLEVIDTVFDDVVTGISAALAKGDESKVRYLPTAVHVCEVMAECPSSGASAALALTTAGALCFELNQLNSALQIAEYVLRHQLKAWGTERRLHDIIPEALETLDANDDIILEETLLIVTTCLLDQRKLEVFFDVMRKLESIGEKRRGQSGQQLLGHFENLAIAYGMRGDLQQQKLSLGRAQDPRLIASNSVDLTSSRHDSQRRNLRGQHARLLQRFYDIPPDKTEKALEVLGRLANTCMLLGDIGGEHQYLTRALCLQNNVATADIETLASKIVTLTSLARLYEVLGDCTKRVAVLKDALRILHVVHEGDLKVAQGMLNLARAYRDNGEFDAAQGLFEETIEYAYSSEEIELARELHLARTLCEFATLRGMQRRYRAQLHLLQKAAFIYEKHENRAPLDEAVNGLVLLAEAYLANGVREKALTILQHVYELVQTTYGSPHYETMHILCRLAAINSSEELYQEAVCFMSAYLGTDYRDVYLHLALFGRDVETMIRFSVEAVRKQYSHRAESIVCRRLLAMLLKTHVYGQDGPPELSKVLQELGLRYRNLEACEWLSRICYRASGVTSASFGHAVATLLEAMPPFSDMHLNPHLWGHASKSWGACASRPLHRARDRWDVVPVVSAVIECQQVRSKIEMMPGENAWLREVFLELNDRVQLEFESAMRRIHDVEDFRLFRMVLEAIGTTQALGDHALHMTSFIEGEPKSDARAKARNALSMVCPDQPWVLMMFDNYNPRWTRRVNL